MTSFTLTKLRSDILNILKKANKPMKAYDILEQLRKIRPNAQPPTVYRVLDFLKTNDAIHEVSHQHSYVVCQTQTIKNKHPINILLICSNCKQVSEEKAGKLINSITSIIKQQHFEPTASTLELVGLCAQCQ